MNSDKTPPGSRPLRRMDEDNASLSSINSEGTIRTPASVFSKTPSLEGISFLDLLEPGALNLGNTRNWVKNYYNEKKKSVKSRVNVNVKNEDLKEIKKFLLLKIDQVYKRIEKTQEASNTEKIFFSISVYLIFFFGFLIGKHPEYVHVLYSVIFVILMPVRLITYYKIGYGYFLADLCYYVNYLLLIYIWIYPNSQMLYISCCSFSWGTLSFAVITWRNKLVLHNIEKLTSTFIHVLPGVIMYVITHQLPYEYKVARFSGSVKLENWNIMYGILHTSFYYVIWQLSYHYFITIKRAEKIKNGRATSFEYLRKAFAKKLIGKFVNSLPEPLPVVAFTVIQYFYQLITMSLCPLLYKYKTFCGIFVSFIFFYSAYNGATYYVDFYGKKFQKEVIRLQREIESLQQYTQQDSQEMSQENSGVSTNEVKKSPVTVSEVLD